MTFLNRADRDYRVTRDPGLRAPGGGRGRWRLQRAGAPGRSPAPATSTTTRPRRHQDSSIFHWQAGGEARFDDLLLRAARGIVQCVRNASRTALKQRAPPRPGPTFYVYINHYFYTCKSSCIIFGPRPHGRTRHARQVVSRHRAVCSRPPSRSAARGHERATLPQKKLCLRKQLCLGTAASSTIAYDCL